MFKPRLQGLSAALCTALLLPVGAHALDGQHIMVHGGSNPAVLPCISCHGADGKGMAAAGFPRLAGLPADYIVKQIQDIKTGKRLNPVMKAMSDVITDDELRAVADAYAALPKVNVAAVETAALVPGSGAWIALRGAWDRNIPECTLCHGPSGLGVGNVFPPLAGQPTSYLENQLKSWKGNPPAKAGKRAAKAPVNTGITRQNDPNGLMQHIAASLTDAEIKAVAEYFGNLADTTEFFDESQHRLR